MKRLFLLIFLVLLGCACQKPLPDKHYQNTGVVQSVDWYNRNFVLEEDGTRIVFTLHSCAGAMPVWQGEHIEIHYRVAPVGGDAAWGYRSCQEFDYVRRIIP